MIVVVVVVVVVVIVVVAIVVVAAKYWTCKMLNLSNVELVTGQMCSR